MKILLIQPPVRDFYQTSIRTQPIGLAYLAASLKPHGHEVEILDCQTGRKRSIPVPPELSYLRSFYPFDDRSPFKLYTGFYHFGMDWGEIRRRIEDSKADAYGISCSFTPYYGEALTIARMIKEGDRSRIVVMGGAHVSCDPQSILRSPFVDYVVLGEGETRFPLLLSQVQRSGTEGLNEIDGIGYRLNGEIRINPLRSFVRDLDALPYPARELLELDRYQIEKKRSTMIITSRGCPHGCAYCSASLVMGTTFRSRDPEGIIEEMAECRKRFDIQAFDIEDDNFTFDQGRAKRMMKMMIRTFGEQTLVLTAMNGISFAAVDGELLRLMKTAGFKTINLSFVTTNSSTRRSVRRPAGPMDFDQVLRETEKAGLHVVAYAIFGMPGQTIPEMVDSLIYLMGKRVLIGPSIYYPTPGTPLFDRCREDGVLSPEPSQWRSSAFPIETKDFSRIDLLTLFRLARTINFVKGKMDGGELLEGKTWKELFRILDEKVKAKVKDENEVQGDPLCPVPHALCNGISRPAWTDLLLLLLRERSFFSLRKSAGRECSVVKEEISKRVLGYFFEKGSEKPILKSRAF
jgi:radical SAM superfamily enzyme YgiQ (UPF0313 family)